MFKFIKGLIDGIKKFFGGIFKKKAKPPEQKQFDKYYRKARNVYLRNYKF